MDSLYLLQFACFIFMLINALILGSTHLHVKWNNRRYEWSRWLILAGMLGLAKKADIVKIVGDHITEKQLRSYLSQLRKEGIIKTEGSKKYTSYMLDENYILNNELRNRAINIGMKTMKENGEI